MTITKSKKLLVQMQDIVDFTGISEPTIKKMVEKVGFPAKKFSGSWYSTTDVIEDWMFNNCYPGGKVKKGSKKLK